jgi:hypothetical protein
MACGGCSKRRSSSNTRAVTPEAYELSGGLDIRSLNNRQINARLEVFKRKFCKTCSVRYTCDYTTYLDCKGFKQR